MNIKNYYCTFSNALSSKFCDEIIKYGNLHQEQLARTGGFDKDILSKEDIKNIKKKRDSKIVWLNDLWIYRQILPYVYQANKNANWNFVINYSESCQFTKYEINQYYGWHCDSWEHPYDRPKDLNLHNKIRKLSVTCALSDPSEYIGGELEFNFNNPEKTKKENIKTTGKLLKGSIVVFPSFVWHRVSPVLQGTRYSLVIWNLGYPYQ